MSSRFLHTIIRPVQESDSDALAGLYRNLNTCNGSEDTVAETIAQTQDFLKGEVFEKFTLVAEVQDAHGQRKVVGSSSLKSTGQRDSRPLVYVETKYGLEVRPAASDAVEFAALIVDPEARGKGLSKTLTGARLFIAEHFKGIIGANKLLVEFLPPYEEGAKTNVFWDKFIYPALQTNSRSEQIFTDLAGRQIATEEEMLKCLLEEFNTEKRNRVVRLLFPQLIVGENLDLDVRKIMNRVGPNTEGALRNLEAFCGQTLSRASYFPVDGGSNYLAPLTGLHNPLTVEVAYGREGHQADYDILAEWDGRGLVSRPLAATRSSLGQIELVDTKGIFTGQVAKLPPSVGEILQKNGEGYPQEISYLKIPRPTRRR